MTSRQRVRLLTLAGLAGLAGLGILLQAGAGSPANSPIAWNSAPEPIASQPAEPITSQPAEPITSQPAEPITSQPAECAGHVLLTFDDGPHPEFTPRILEALEASGATATFFAEGQLVETHPEVAARVVQEGHGLQNHTWDHPYLTSLSAEEVTSQLERTGSAIEKATGTAPTQWRPPYEDYDPAVESSARSLGLEMVLWDYETDTNDWRGASPEQIRDVVLDNATDGSIVLMHDRIENTADAVPMILDGLHQKGLCTR